MLKLYCYPKMFGLPDNNPFGLKVDTFLRLAKIDYEIINTINTENVPRKQLPCIEINNNVISDSNKIINFLTREFKIELNNHLTPLQNNIAFLITRTLDCNLYWIMSYSRWQDDRFWPLFKAAFLKFYPDINDESLDKGRKYNTERYYYQGIGRYDVAEVYNSGLNDLQIIVNLLDNNRFIFGDKFSTIDATIYGYLANIYYFEIDTPLREYLIKNAKLTRYINNIRSLLDY